MTDEAYDAYTHLPIADIPDAVNAALQQIADNLQRQVLAPVIPKYYEPPARVYDGLQVFADGLNWNPGFGRGIYVWDSSIDIVAIQADGQLVGTIPAWEPPDDYNIQLTFGSPGATPVQAQPLVSSNVTGNNRSVVEQLTGNEVFGQHASGSAGGIGNVTSAALVDDTVNLITFRVNAGIAAVEVVINGVSSTSLFNHQGAPSFTTIFDDADSPIADGILISRLVMSDVGGGDNRVYLFDDGLSGIIADTGGGGQDGTWNNILSGNVVAQEGAWTPLTNA